MKTLVDKDATKEAIEGSFNSLTQSGTSSNDRVLFFFAGHGHTVSGNRGEVGFLVPHAGDPEKVGSLIEWHSLVKRAELISAKHILFILDACFSGLVFQRKSLDPGSTRFLRDIMTRRGRQGLAAGKSDQLVSDAGGPLPGHSVFTGYLLKGMRGDAADKNGVLTANGLSSFLYQTVSSDYDSSQTPAHGTLDGEGDFVFYPDPVVSKSPSVECEKTIEVPVVVSLAADESREFSSQVKRFLADDSKAIALDDLLVGELRRMLGLIGADRVEMSGKEFSEETIQRRLGNYEEETRPLRTAMASIGYWGREDHAPLVQKILLRLAESTVASSGVSGWLALSHFPFLLSFYSFSMAAVIGGKYRQLSEVIKGRVGGKSRDLCGQPILLAAGKSYLELIRSELFKQLGPHKRQYAPASEYIHLLLQPEFDDLLFLGESYEDWFDQFEAFFGLAYVHQEGQTEHVWAPAGRYAWKYRYGSGDDPISRMKKAVKQECDNWAPLKAGFFGGSAASFSSTAERMEEGFLLKLKWH